MRVAYADPPYPGQAKRHYGDHPDYAGEVDHAELIARLERDYPDGWALSTSAAALRDVLALCPTDHVRICAWIRGSMPKPPARLMWTWEPLIVRIPSWRMRHAHDFIRDSLPVMQPSGFLGGKITGAKPTGFSEWLFNVLGLGPDDEFVDIFPGSGAVGQAWEAWRAQLSLLDGAA